MQKIVKNIAVGGLLITLLAFSYAKNKHNQTTEFLFADATINHSLFRAARKAHVPDSITMQMIAMFGSEVDFHHIHPGDYFDLLYTKDHVIAATFTDKQHIYEAIRFTDASGYTGYYTPTGKNTQLTFLRFPVHFVYISSHFSHRRLEPIIHIYRPHLGIDLAANRGTPVHAACSGRITHRAHSIGYGNVIYIRHSAKYSTRYAHLWRFAKGLHVGSHVKKGQIIAYVGETGYATGPHLHYEVRVYGKARDPLKIKLPHGKPISKKDLQKFIALSRQYISEIKERAL